MALNKINVQLPLSQGIDTKVDPKQIDTGKLLVLQNAIFQSPKQLEKRNGFSQLPVTPSSQGDAISVFNSSNASELLAEDGTSLYSYSPSENAWSLRGQYVDCGISVNSIIASNSNYGYGDSAIIGNIKCVAIVGSLSYFSLIDLTTGQYIVSNIPLTGYNTPVKMLAFNGNFIALYVTPFTTDLSYVVINPTTKTITGGGNFASDIDGTKNAFDAQVINNQIVIAYSSGAFTLKVFAVPTSLVPGAAYTLDGTSDPSAIGLFSDSSNNVWVSYVVTTNVYYAIAGSNISSTVLAKTLVGTTSVTSQRVCGAYANGSGVIYYEDGSSNVAGTLGNQSLLIINASSATSSGSVSSLFSLRSVGIASKAFVYNNTPYIYCAFRTIQQSTFFVINGLTGAIIAKLMQGDAGTETGNYMIPEVNVYNSNSFQTVLAKQTFNYLGNSINVIPQEFVVLGLNAAAITFNPSGIPSKINMGNNHHLTGGILSMYDGQNVVEHSYHVYPEGVGYSSITQTGGGIGIGTSTAAINQLQYVAVYQWIDAQGNTHLSAPSTPLTLEIIAGNTITFTGAITLNNDAVTGVSSVAGLYQGQVITSSYFPTGTYIRQIRGSTVYMSENATSTSGSTAITTNDTNKINLIIPTLRLTQKQNVNILIYRTTVNQTVFYYVGSVNNLTTVDTVTFSDTNNDNYIIQNTELYTTGGVLENIAAPAISIATPFKSRILAVPYESPQSFWFSQSTDPGSPVQFNDSLVWNVDSRINSITAIGILDEKIILFGPSSKYYVVGDGPTANGQNNDFSEAQRIAGVTGCVNHASVVETQVGLIYQDPTKGIYLLDRSLQEQYIGFPVEAYNSLTVTSAKVIPNNTIVRFTLSNNMTLCYDYVVNQWSTDVYAASAIDATVFQNNFIWLTAGGLVNKETVGSYTDNGQPILINFSTGWFDFDNIEGFQRIYEVQIFGTYYSPHTLTVSIYANYSSTPQQVVTIPVLTQPNPYQFRIRLNDSVQKSEAIQINIQESQSGSYGQGFAISGIALRAGIKTGLYKLPASQSY